MGVISIIVGVYRYNFKQETTEFNNYIFENVTTTANNILLNISNLHLSLARNQSLSNFLREADPLYYSNDKTYKLLEDIKAYNEFIVNIDLFFIYLKELDVVLSTHGIVTSRLFYNTYFSGSGISYEHWIQTLLNGTNDRFITMNYNDEEKGVKESLAFLFHLPLGESKGIGVITSEKRHFVEGINNIKWKNLCDIYIYNKSGNLTIYAKKSPGEEIPQTIVQAEEYENNSKFTLFLSDVIVNEYNWKVVAIVENDALNKRISFIRMFVYVISFVALLSLFFIVKFLLKLHYSPIKTMLSLFGVAAKKMNMTFYIIQSIKFLTETSCLPIITRQIQKGSCHTIFQD